MKRPSGWIWTVVVLGMLLLLPAGVFAQQEAAAAAPSTEGIVHTVAEGDSLWDLSAKYLGSPWKWTEIWERNRFITNPHYIYPGVKVVIVPPPPKEVSMGEEAAPAAAPAPVAAAPVPSQKVSPPAPAPVPYLEIKPSDFVRAGEFLRELPKGVGRVRDGRDPKVGFSENDTVYLALDKAIPVGQLLGVYRVRGPVEVVAGRPFSGYVKYLIGVLQVGPVVDGQVTGRVRQSFEDITREDLLSEEIPAYSRVRIAPGEDGIPSVVIATRQQNKEISEGDFIYLDRGASSGVAVGNVFRVFAPAGAAGGAPEGARDGMRTEVARAVVVRVTPDFSSAYVANSTESFAAGVAARRGVPAK